MASVTKKRLYGPDGSALLRDNRVALDAPAAGDWTPDNLNAAEISGGVVADDVTLDAREWETVQIVTRYNGSVDASETVDVVPLIAVPDPEAASPTTTRIWAELPSLTIAPHLATDFALVQGHDCAFRLDGVTLGTATSVDIIISGGERRRLGED